MRGMGAHQHGAHDHGTVGADQERGLGPGGRERHHERLDGAAVELEKHYQSLGGSGGAGVGYGAPAAIGAALANKKHGRLSVTIQGDGDFCMRPASGGRRRITGFRCSP